MFKSRIKKWRLDKKKKVGNPEPKSAIFIDILSDIATIKDDEMRAVIRKGLKRQAEGKGPVFLVRGRRIDLDSAFCYFRRKHIDPAHILEQVAPPTPDEVQPLSPVPLPPHEKDPITPDADSNAYNQTVRIPPFLVSSKDFPESTPNDAFANLFDFGNPSILSAYESFRTWYTCSKTYLLKEDPEFVELAYLPPAPTRGLDSANDFRIIEDLVAISHDCESHPTTHTFNNGHCGFMCAMWGTNFWLMHGECGKALEEQARATEMLADMVHQRPYSLISAVLYLSVSFFSNLLIENSVLPTLAQILSASKYLLSPRHPLARTASIIMATYQMDLSPAFRTHLLVLYLRNFSKERQHYALLGPLCYLSMISWTRNGTSADPSIYWELFEYMEELREDVKIPEASCDASHNVAMNDESCWNSVTKFVRLKRSLDIAQCHAATSQSDDFNKHRYYLFRESVHSLELHGRWGEGVGTAHMWWYYAKEDFGIRHSWTSIAKDCLDRLLEKARNKRGHGTNSGET